MKARLSTCWSLPPFDNPNAVANALRRGMHLRWPFIVPANYVFHPEHSSVLSEAWTHQQMAQALGAIPGIMGIIANVHVHAPGNVTGTGYHDAGGRGYPPRLNLSRLDDYCSALFDWLWNRGVPVFGAQLGNEVTYHPEHSGSWTGYLDDLWSATLVMQQQAERFFPGIQIISGGQHGNATSRGRKTFNQYLIDEGHAGGMWLDYHANGGSIESAVNEMGKLTRQGAKVAILEDRAPGSDNDALNRARAFSDAGAKVVSCFLSRNVDFDGSNPACLWGVRPTGKKNRSTGAPWTCAGFQQRDWDNLTQAAQWLGAMQGDPADDLPMNGNGGNGGTMPEAPGHDHLRAAINALTAGNEDRYTLKYGEFFDKIHDAILADVLPPPMETPDAD